MLADLEQRDLGRRQKADARGVAALEAHASLWSCDGLLGLGGGLNHLLDGLGGSLDEISHLLLRL